MYAAVCVVCGVAYRAVYMAYTATISIVIIVSELFYFLRDGFESLVLTPICKRIPSWITPDGLSWSRVPLAAGIDFFLFVHPAPVLAELLYTIAWVTDILDGALARHRKQFSKNGGMIDPLTDKIMNGGIFGGYYFFSDNPLIVAIRPTITLVLEVDLLLFVLAGISKKFLTNIPKVKANFCGKCKFGLQCASGMLLFYGLSYEAGMVLQAAVVMGGMSAIGYIYKARNARWK